MKDEMIIKETAYPHPHRDFGETYFSLRKKEYRVYTDEELRLLPDITGDHRYAAEWRIRKTSGNRLFEYLRSKRRYLEILEVGCGNGWLCARLSDIPGSMVMGIDICRPELEQAGRVFFDKTNLEFCNCSLHDVSATKKFDIIVFAASIQYFPSIPEIIQEAMKSLNEGGEIHILDTKFYSETEVIAARKRSADYFKSQGSEEMSCFYFHHELNNLNGFSPSILFNPHNIRNRIFHKGPFHWICLYKK